jgi:hypothetical protein
VASDKTMTKATISKIAVIQYLAVFILVFPDGCVMVIEAAKLLDNRSIEHTYDGGDYHDQADINTSLL